MGLDAKLYYRKAKGDKTKEFALVADNVWIWYSLGFETTCVKDKLILYPYLPSDSDFNGKWRLLKHYTYNDASKIGTWIGRRILKKLINASK